MQKHHGKSTTPERATSNSANSKVWKPETANNGLKVRMQKSTRPESMNTQNVRHPKLRMQKSAHATKINAKSANTQYVQYPKSEKALRTILTRMSHTQLAGGDQGRFALLSLVCLKSKNNNAEIKFA